MPRLPSSTLRPGCVITLMTHGLPPPRPGCRTSSRASSMLSFHEPAPRNPRAYPVPEPKSLENETRALGARQGYKAALLLSWACGTHTLVSEEGAARRGRAGLALRAAASVSQLSSGT